jgi:hypothetical protein
MTPNTTPQDAEAARLAEEANRLARQLSSSAYSQGVADERDSWKQQEKYDKQAREQLAQLSSTIDRLRDLASRADSPVEERQFYRHVKSGGEYELICRAIDEANPELSRVIYRSATGVLWDRVASEFDDGRFVRIDAPAVEAKPTAERDRDWILAISNALGLDSGHRVPIVPSVDEFKRLFADVAASASPSEAQKAVAWQVCSVFTDAPMFPARDTLAAAKADAGTVKTPTTIRALGVIHPSAGAGVPQEVAMLSRQASTDRDELGEGGMRMSTHKVAELTGALLDAAVAKAEGFPSFWIDPGDGDRAEACVLGPARAGDGRFDWCPSTAWEQGGPILDREGVAVEKTWISWGENVSERNREGFRACVGRWDIDSDTNISGEHEQTGRTYLVAAMRAYVASKLGETVELP